MYVQPLEGSLAAPLSLSDNLEGEGTLFQGTAAAPPGDNISRFMPPWLGDGSAAPPGEGSFGNPPMAGLLGPLMGLMQQLMQMLQSLMGYGGAGAYGGSGTPYGSGCGNERFFQNASGSSRGDPHLSFNGARWNSMASQPDLLNSDSFAGGYRISTQATPENSRGVSWNRSATVSLDNGATTISLNDNGRPSIVCNGRQMSISPGQTLGLGNGESVTCEQNGALQVTANNGMGGSITTTLTARDNGVDVDVSAHDVDLGGTLVNGGGPIPIDQGPVQAPISGPIFAPWSNSAGPPFSEV